MFRSIRSKCAKNIFRNLFDKKLKISSSSFQTIHSQPFSRTFFRYHQSSSDEFRIISKNQVDDILQANVLAGDHFEDEESSKSDVVNQKDLVFDYMCDPNTPNKLPVITFIRTLQRAGLRTNDPRLKDIMEKISQLKKSISEMDAMAPIYFNRHLFNEIVSSNFDLIKRAVQREFIIPHWRKFSSTIDQIYINCKENSEGNVANYIPQLARYSPDFWGVSICTVDGQRHSVGDTSIPFCLQSCSKPLAYSICLNDIGVETTHQYVGREPSGRMFNEISLNHDKKPHNPYINAGAIVVASLLRPDMKTADRFDYVQSAYRKLAGREHIGFSNPTFLSEKETADRNFALGFYLKENKCFPEGTNLMDVMEFYFQLCSVEVTCESASVMAATLANSGINPLTNERVLDAESVKHTLTLMHSCGMYDYSGEMAFKVGLPAKSGVSGAILIVIPNTAGFCLWSPPLDRLGNSVRGMQFCEELINIYNFHQYDNLQHSVLKIDPRKTTIPVEIEEDSGDEEAALARQAHYQHLRQQYSEMAYTCFLAALHGDVETLHKLHLLNVNMRVHDYDKRTALHIAASEGHLPCVQYLVEKAHLNMKAEDRWKRTPLDNAKQFKRRDIVEFLETKLKEEATIEEEKSSTN
ncbi:hypothetical protein SNEBB_002436 [Seison nebaliae]|nr:hypothetical protein SNEBB_002436 [Seison nebaliae]